MRIYLLVGDSSAKAEVIPHVVPIYRDQSLRTLEEELARYQLVGGVMAYQGDDG